MPVSVIDSSMVYAQRRAKNIRSPAVAVKTNV